MNRMLQFLPGDLLRGIRREWGKTAKLKRLSECSWRWETTLIQLSTVFAQQHRIICIEEGLPINIPSSWKNGSSICGLENVL